MSETTIFQITWFDGCAAGQRNGVRCTSMKHSCSAPPLQQRKRHKCSVTPESGMPTILCAPDERPGALAGVLRLSHRACWRNVWLAAALSRDMYGSLPRCL